MHVTPQAMEAAYEFLRALPPFSRWKLPEADDVEFHVVSFNYYCHADCSQKENGTHVIRVNRRLCGTPFKLIRDMAHEMCHLHLHDVCDYRTDHGAPFQNLRDQVCRAFVWHPNEF